MKKHAQKRMKSSLQTAWNSQMRACNHQQQTIIFLAIPTDIIRMFLPRILYKAKTRLYIYSSDIREITSFTPLRFLHQPSPVARKKRFSETWIDSLSKRNSFICSYNKKRTLNMLIKIGKSLQIKNTVHEWLIKNYIYKNQYFGKFLPIN